MEQGFFPASIQPGDLTAQLLQCRTKAGLDLEQAAEELRLSPQILKALENEDFAHLPEPPYVRGYLRGYAKLAGVDAKELIRTYDVLRGAKPEEPVKRFTPAHVPHKAPSSLLSSSTMKFIALGAAVLLLGLLSIMPGVREWVSQTWSAFSRQNEAAGQTRPPSAIEAYALEKAKRDQEENRQAAAQTASPPATTPAPTAGAGTDAVATAPVPTTAGATATETAKPVVESVPATTPAPAADQASPTQPLADAKPLQQETVATDAKPAAAVANTNPAQPTAPSVAVASANTAAQPVPPSTAPVAADAPQAVGQSAGTDVAASTATQAVGDPASTTTEARKINIKLEFSQEVWAQIKGTDRKTLYEALNKPNTIQEIETTPPLEIKLGNAQGVKVFINGEPFDTAPHTKGSVARIKIPE